MAEDLTPADVEAYTNGRLLASDPETLRGLTAALTRVRHVCGWHVSPVRADTVIFDGPGNAFIQLPTLRIVSIDAVTENGEATDVAEVAEVREGPGIIAKTKSRWAYGFSAIEVDFTHGYPAVEAEDFREAVLSLVDRASLSVGVEGGGAQLVEKEVDDVRYRWSDNVVHTTLDEAAVSQFRILPI